MDSTAPTQLPTVAAPIEPGSTPLKNVAYERFSVLRAAMFGRVEAGRESGMPHSRANLAKVERKKEVRQRIDYLAKDTAAAVQRLRAKIMQKLNIISDTSVGDFIRMEKDPEQVKHISATVMDPKAKKAQLDALPILPWLDLARIVELGPEDQREILSAIKSVSCTEHGPKLEFHSPLDAIAQLRKMTGLDAPENLNLSGNMTLEALVGASYNQHQAKQIEQQNTPTQEAAE